MATYRALSYLKKIQPASFFTYSKGFMIGFLYQKIRGLKLLARTVTHPVVYTCLNTGVNWRERLEGENTLEEDLFALFEDLKNSGPRGNNRVKQVRQSSWMLQ